MRKTTVATIKLLTLLILILGFGPPSPATLAAESLEILPVSTDVIEIPVKQGKLIRLSRPASGVFLADAEIADVAVQSPTLVHIVARRTGTTTLYAIDNADRVIANLTLISSFDTDSLGDVLSEVLPHAQISLKSVSGALIITGSVATAAEAAEAVNLATAYLPQDTQLINQLRIIGANQVNLRVRIAEVSRDVMKTLGVGLESLTNFGNFSFGLMSGGGLVAAEQNALLTGFASGSTSVEGLIDAMEDEGLITLLAEPNLTAMSGQEASFLAGGEFPIPVAREDNELTIEFRSFGVGLAFTPTVLDNGRINLFVNPEVSSLSNVGAITLGDLIIPALSTRRASTSVEIGSGQSLAIAGLIDNRVTTSVADFPGLSELPVLGPLFRSTEFQNQETELVIIVTPYLVRPVQNMALATPMDDYSPATDQQMRLHGQTWQSQLPSVNPSPLGAAQPRLIGPAGFEVSR